MWKMKQWASIGCLDTHLAKCLVADARDYVIFLTRKHQILFNRRLIAGLPQYLLLLNLMMSIGRLWARPCIWGRIPLGWSGLNHWWWFKGTHESMTCQWIYWFLQDVPWVILDHWSWSWILQRNPPWMFIYMTEVNRNRQ